MKLKITLILTMAQLYKDKIPGLPKKYSEFWHKNINKLLVEKCEITFSTVHNENEFCATIANAEKTDSDLLIVLPMSYAPSEAAQALINTKLPLAIISTAMDFTLPSDMEGDRLLANQAMHGVMDLTNMLWRANRQYHMISGHFEQSGFKEQFNTLIKVAKASRILQKGNAGRIGEPFAGMLDLTYSDSNLKKSLGFNVKPLSAEDLVINAKNVDKKAVKKFIDDLSNTFNVSDGFTPEELDASARMALALEKLQLDNQVDSIAMNFMPVVAAGAKTLPFLGACNLMKRGIGYSGEADVLTATLTTALSQISLDSTFTELYSPDYERNELFLSHMGECNYGVANKKLSIELKPKPFNWGNCLRPAVPVFQMKPGKATLVSLSETPDKKSFQLLAFEAEVIETKVQTKLTVPYTNIKLKTDIRDFLIKYSKHGGTHHLSLIYDCDIRNIEALADLCQIKYKTMEN